MKTRQYSLMILFLSTSLLISCGSNERKDPTEAEKVQVETTSASTQVPKTLNFKGKIEAANSVTIKTRTSSFVERVLVKIGDQVQRGQLLVQLNNADLIAQKAQIKAQIDRLEAELNHAQRDMERYQNLRAKQSISEKELEQMELKLASVRAQSEGATQQLQEVNAQLKYFDIRAPFDGIITSKTIQEGDLVNPQQAMLQLDGDAGFEIKVSVSERDIKHIQQRDSAMVHLDQNTSQISAIISEVSASSMASGGQYIVKATLISDEKENLLSGMKASLQLTTNDTESGVFVPTSAIVRRGELKGLYVVSQQNTALLRWVRTGQLVGGHIEILSGLTPDEQVITKANSKLYNGIKVSL